MKSIGLDIGTTTISAVVAENQKILTSLTINNPGFIPTANAWERIQDPAALRESALGSVRELFSKYLDIGCIGVTGQMHGIVYLSAAGEPVSPLYTWQDGRGDLPAGGGESFTQKLSRLTGYPLSTGYGIVTHYYNQQNGLIPENAAVFCTIHDYIAMCLASSATPKTDAGDAASLGAFCLEEGRFDTKALSSAGVDIKYLPALAQTPVIGYYNGSVPVAVAIGDNQASFIGATAGQTNAMLVNIGTGGQFSVCTEKLMSCSGLETRPFPGGGYLLVGASLCGGRAYALLEQFFRSTAAAMSGFAAESCYAAMETLLSGAPKPDDLPVVIPLFQGTRADPTRRASVSGLSASNFTPRHLCWALLEGMAQELYEMYRSFLAAGGSPAPLIGSGNGLQKNRYLQDCVSRRFSVPLIMSSCEEEAAFGAALFALSVS